MFLNPLMLAGLGGALVPLILHLLSRARYRSVDWGAMMFLDGADPTDRRSSRLKQYVLLATRMAIVAVLAVALARPLVGNAWANLAPGASTTAVLILDCSASMATIENGRWRMDAARDAAAAFLSQLRDGDRVALLTPGVTTTAETDAGVQPSSDLRTVAARVAAARPGRGHADMATALTRAGDLLAKHARGRNGRVAIVTDRQAINWRDVSPEFARNWQSKIDGRDRADLLTILPVGTDAADNLAVESVRLVNPPAVKGERAEVEVRVRNHGPGAQPNVAVTLSRNGRPATARTLAVGARDVATVRFTTRFDAVGSQLLTAAIAAGAGLPDDDAASATIDVTAPVAVLFVSGDEPDAADGAADGADGADGNASARPAESTFFRVAAAPYAAMGKQGIDPAVVTVVPTETFEPTSVASARVVVLANVAQVPPAAVKALEQFVYEGGGLLIAPGGMTDVEQLNAALWRDGAGIMPARLQPATTATGSAATTLLGLDFSHPALAFLRGRPDPIPVATIGRYFPATPRQPDATVPATYASGKPFLVDAKWGRGRVAVVTTPLDADWSTLPLSGFYVPFVQSLVRHLATADTDDRNLVAGQPLFATLTDATDVTLQLPAGARATPAVRAANGRTEVRYDDTAEPGVYAFRYRDRARNEGRTLHFVVGGDRDESDTAAVSPKRWDELAATLGARRLDAADATAIASLGLDRDGRELWAPLLLLAAVLLAIELALGRLWSTAIPASNKGGN